MHYLKHRSLFVLGLILVFVLTSVPAAAQAPLYYGSGTFGSLSAQAPFVIYTFQGQENDLVTLSIMSLTPDLQTSISLNNANGQQIATSSTDPFSVGNGNTRLSTQLASNGFFTVIIASANGVQGDFAIRLDGSSVDATADISTDEDVTNTVSANGAMVFNIAGDPDYALLATLSATTPDYTFTASLKTALGNTLATFSGSSVQPVFMTIPASDSVYQVFVTSTGAIDGDITISLSTGLPQGSPTDVPDTTSTPEETSEATLESTITVTSTEDATQQITPETTQTIAATPTPTNTQQASTTATEQQLQPDDPTATQSQQQNASTATYTYTPSPTVTFTPSYTSTYIPTATRTATATYTPSYTPTTPPPQIAPEDQRTYAMDVELDTTASILEFVSYPGGDREDRVAYDVTGMNPNVAFSGGRARLVISASCFGQNVEEIEFFAQGQTYSCGQTIVDREVTFDSNNGSITIRATGGEATYVQWVLTATATRIN